MALYTCPNCGANRAKSFYHEAQVPVNSCLLFSDVGRAQSLPTGDIDLAFCPNCSFIFNGAWKPKRTIYSDQYEETQGYSPTFKAFHRRLARDLIDRYGLVDKDIVEIGCGKGEFLSMLCEIGRNRGVGYDPSFIPERSAHVPNVTVRREFFSEATISTIQSVPHLVCCKMTLEHIFETQRFVQAIRRITSPERGTIVFFQVPDVRRILTEGAFWDVYYEHCCYFSPTSLDYLFRSCGFEVLRTSTGFDNQYLTIEARPTDALVAIATDGEGVANIGSCARHFAALAAQSIQDWASKITTLAASGGRTVVWGSGSKAVAFLAATGVSQKVQYLVDINPYRHGKYVPGSGTEIVAPEFLTKFQPDLVIAMNPVYRQEIAADLDRQGCRSALLCAVGDSPSVAAPPGVSPSLADFPSAWPT